MGSKEMPTKLTTFVKAECANCFQQTCINDKPCKVLSGERCGYFEKAVLGPPDYKYRVPGYDYQKLFAQYAEQTGAESQKVKVRRCACGEPLSTRQRFCDKCSRKRRKLSGQEAQRKYREKQTA